MSLAADVLHFREGQFCLFPLKSNRVNTPSFSFALVSARCIMHGFHFALRSLRPSFSFTSFFFFSSPPHPSHFPRAMGLTEYAEKIDTSYFCSASRLHSEELGHVFIILFQPGYLVQASSHVLHTLDIPL